MGLGFLSNVVIASKFGAGGEMDVYLAAATWADISKAKTLLDWEPKVSLEEGIEKTIHWYFKNRDLMKNIEIDLSV